MGILHQPTITGFDKAKATLDHAKWMLYLESHFGFIAVLAVNTVTQWMIF